jgi:hypothetical protein
MFGKKKRIRTDMEHWEYKRKLREKNGYLKLKLVKDTGYWYRLDHGVHFLMDYMNGYTYDLILADIFYNLLKNEICMAVLNSKKLALITEYKKEHIDAAYSPGTLIRSREDGQVIAFRPIRKDLIAEEVIERCWGEDASATMMFHALLRTPEEISGWPLAELKRLSEPENCKFTIFADENWEHTIFEINPAFFTKQELIQKINETLADYNMKLEVPE